MDRGALDAAIELGIPHGGWCPRGRMAEDGPIPPQYNLTETRSRKYQVRTRQNVLDSDATLILHRGPLSGGTELTARLAETYHKPCLLVDLDSPPDPDTVRQFLSEHQVETLNVAGPRESQSPCIAVQTTKFIGLLFKD